MKTITLSEAIGKEFKSVEIDSEELKKIIEEFLKDTHPDREITRFTIEDEGISVILDTGERVEIKIDWNELIVK